MYISSLELADFRNIVSLHMDFSQGTNILYGENAQGKTNILESLYMISTTKSHRGVRDKDMIRFGMEESHIRSLIMKGGIDYRVDMHLRKNRSKGIAINGQRIRKASELIGLLHIVFFSPEDLCISYSFLLRTSVSSRKVRHRGGASWIWSSASLTRLIFTI